MNGTLSRKVSCKGHIIKITLGVVSTSFTAWDRSFVMEGKRKARFVGSFG